MKKFKQWFYDWIFGIESYGNGPKRVLIIKILSFRMDFGNWYTSKDCWDERWNFNEVPWWAESFVDEMEAAGHWKPDTRVKIPKWFVIVNNFANWPARDKLAWIAVGWFARSIFVA